MTPLQFQLTGVRSSVYNYPAYSNLLRKQLFNQQQMVDRVNVTSYSLENQHPLVQLLSLMNIDPTWDYQYLCAIVEMNYDRWASQLELTCVYNKGKGYTNVFYHNGFYEHLVAAPLLMSLKEYDQMPPNWLCPIIPIYSTETRFDYLPVGDEYKESKRNGKDFAVIAIDLMALAVGYWKHMNKCIEENTPEQYYYGRWLTFTPFINARLFQLRLSNINVLYESIINGTPIKDSVILRKTPMNVNDIKDNVIAHLSYMDALFRKHPSKYMERVIQHLIPADNLPIDNRVLQPGKYRLYSQSSWVWQMPVMKLYSMVHSYNKAAGYVNDTLVPLTARWLLIPSREWSRNINDAEFKKHFDELWSTTYSSFE